jgi:hypothetical protein
MFSGIVWKTGAVAERRFATPMPLDEIEEGKGSQVSFPPKSHIAQVSRAGLTATAGGKRYMSATEKT